MAIPRQRIIWLALALWLIACATGLAGMAAYANRPGASAHAPASWPTASHLVLDPARPTLVMFAHPKCPCTRASLAELAGLLARAPHASTTYVMFMKPATSDKSWDETVLWKAASAIPGVIAIQDDGHETERFGAETSGQVLLYGTDGRLLFSGGTRGGSPEVSQSAVFGGPLSNPRPVLRNDGGAE
jgi:hypothetical protein